MASNTASPATSELIQRNLANYTLCHYSFYFTGIYAAQSVKVLNIQYLEPNT